jgi:hypothetical protein
MGDRVSDGGGTAPRRRQPPGAGLIGQSAAGVLFFCLLTPLAFVLRLCGRDRLRLRLDPLASSYWIARDPAAGRQTAMTRQL